VLFSYAATAFTLSTDNMGQLRNTKLGNKHQTTDFVTHPLDGRSPGPIEWSTCMAQPRWLHLSIQTIVSRYRPVKRASIGLLILLMLPMLVDGITHTASAFRDGGLFEGFCYINAWLTKLTGNALPAWFYVGDKLRSFHSWIRLVSGVSFGVVLI
jgi:hypothetical protein